MLNSPHGLGNLPPQLTSFIGRERELAEYRALLGQTRLLSLTGAGGCGKTRLALQLADQVRDDFADGVWWTELAALTDSALIPQTVASALGVREQPGHDLLDTLVETLQAKRLLLVLDNCEHVVAACAALAQRLLAACRDLRILATTQETLRVRAETSRTVPPLALPEPVGQGSRVAGERGYETRSTEYVTRIMKYDAVRLFVERASSGVPTFTVTAETADLIATICQRLDGIPLAIELAAARVKVLSLEQVQRRLDNAMALLKSDVRVTPSRYQTLRAALDWSFGLLSPQEQTLLRCLAVFAGGFTLEAAEEVIGDWRLEIGPPVSSLQSLISKDDVLDLITSLVDKSFIVVEKRSGISARYRLLETIRQYGQEKLRAIPTEAHHSYHRHVAYFLAQAERAEAAFATAEQGQWTDWVDEEEDNLRMALDWSQSDDAHELGLRLAGSLWRYWWRRGYYSEGRDYLKLALAQAGSAPTPPRAKALRGLGYLVWQQGDYGAAYTYFQTALEIRRQLDDKPAIGRLLNNMGQVAMKQGDYDTAQRRFAESLALWEELGDKVGIANSLQNIGIILNYQGNYAVARAPLERSLALRRELGDKFGIARLLNTLGETARGEGDFATAATYYEQSLALNTELRSRSTTPWPLHNLGYVSLDRGDNVAAIRHFQQALTIFDEQGHKEGVGACLAGLAGVAGRTGQAERAARLFGAAHAILDVVGVVLVAADRAEHDRNVELTQTALGERHYLALHAAGQGMTQTQAVIEALSLSSSAPRADTLPTSDAVATTVTSPPDLRLVVLGQSQVYRGERLLTAADGFFAKAREMLFYLVSGGGRTRAQLALALWPEASSEQLRHSLHNTLHQLRGALGRREWIVHENGVYAFNPQIETTEMTLTAWSDLAQFEAQVVEGQRVLATDPTSGIALLKEAVALYRGDFLGDEVYDWATERQEELRRLFQEAALALGQALCHSAQYGLAVEVYRRVISLDVYQEAAHQGLMLALARQGERTQALRQYQSLVDLLRRDLDADPDPKTTALYERLRRGDM